MATAPTIKSTWAPHCTHKPLDAVCSEELLRLGINTLRECPFPPSLAVFLSATNSIALYLLSRGTRAL